MAEGLCHDDDPENLLATKFKHNGINSHISLLIFLLVADYDPGMYKEVSIDFVNKYQHTHLHTYIQISQVVGWQKCSFQNDHVYDLEWQEFPDKDRDLDSLCKNGQRFFIWHEYVKTKNSKSGSSKSKRTK